MAIVSKNSIVIKQGKNFKSLNKIDLLTDSVNNNDKTIIKSQQDQMFSGKDNANRKIKPKYKSEKYSEYKNKENPLPGKGIPDLKLSGDMYNSMFLEVSDNEYTIGSDVDYFDALKEKYGTAFGLSKQTIKKTPEVNNEYLKLVHKKLNK